jgi:hypothetical protein
MANHPRPAAFSDDAFPLQAVTGTIIAGAFAVFERFGHGFLESVYRRALAVELRHRGVQVLQEVKYELFHRGEPVGCYKADMVVGCSEHVAPAHSTVVQRLPKPKRLLSP